MQKVKLCRAIEMPIPGFGGELVSLELEKPYPQNYQAVVRRVEEENNRNFLPPLKTGISHIKRYERSRRRFSNGRGLMSEQAGLGRF